MKIVVFVFVFLFRGLESLEVDCGFETRNKLTCRCVGPYRSTDSYEDLSAIIESYVDVEGRFRNLYFRHVELRDCDNVDLYLDLRQFVAGNRVQNISNISFDRIKTLNLIIQDIDYGYKEFVFSDVGYLVLSGELEHYDTNVQIYVRYFPDISPDGGGDVLFENFLARSEISLINILDARTVRVASSYFENLREVEIRGNPRCHVGKGSVEPVRCSQDELFVSEATFPSTIEEVVRHPLFIAGAAFILIAIVVAIISILYVRHHRRKSQMELLGYPASSSVSSDIPTKSSGVSHISGSGRHYRPSTPNSKLSSFPKHQMR